MASSRKRAAAISSIASSLYFFLIAFQVPLFRIQCRSGICTTPVEVTCSQLIADEIFPEFVVKVLLYPGAFTNAIMKSKSIPSYSKLLRFYNLTNQKNSPETDLLRLEIIAGSYLCVAGAAIRAGRMSLIGTLLLLWGLAKEVIIYPTMSFVMICSFLSIRKDLRKIFRCYKAIRRQQKSLRLKAKYA